MKTYLSLALVLVLSCSVYAHSDQEIENELVRLHGQMEKYSNYGGEYDGDDRDEKLTAANKVFKETLSTLTAQHPSLLRYSFPKLSKDIFIKTSGDVGLRLYSWDTLNGGTMHSYDTVYQFAGVEGVYSRGSFYDEGDIGAFVTDIFDIDTKTGTIYLVVTTARLSTSYNGQTIAAFQIDGNSLSDSVKIFQTSSGKTDSIGFAYDFFSVVDREERPIRLFEYDSRSKTLSFPVVIEDEKTPQGRVTSAKIKYRFDGEYFVLVK